MDDLGHTRFTMEDATWTTVILCSSLAALVAWDIRVAFFNSMSNDIDTFSGQIRAVALRVRGLPFSFGALGAHFFWPGRPLVDQPWAAIILVVVGILISMPLWIRNRKFRLPIPPMWLALVVGIIAGRCLWSFRLGE